MTRTRIRLDTMADISKFVSAMSQIDCEVSLSDDEGHCVNAKSMLGVMYSTTEFKRLWCYCEKDIGGKLLPFMLDSSDR